MKKLMFLGVVAALSAPASAESERKPGAKDTNLVCRDLGTIGSRLQRKRVCLTREQWAEQKRIQRSELERAQNRSLPPSAN